MNFGPNALSRSGPSAFFAGGAAFAVPVVAGIVSAAFVVESGIVVACGADASGAFGSDLSSSPPHAASSTATGISSELRIIALA